MNQQENGKVTALGGVFIYANNPHELAEWYENHLGLSFLKASDKVFYVDFKYQVPGIAKHEFYTVFSIMGKPLAHDKPTTFTLNLRVDNLDILFEALKEKQIEVRGIEIHAEGKFAWINDLEGNYIELWEDTLA